jgi:hypothetical protein
MKISSLCLSAIALITLIEPNFTGYFLFLIVSFVVFKRTFALRLIICSLIIIVYLFLNLLNGLDVRFFIILFVFLFWIYFTISPSQQAIKHYVELLTSNQYVILLVCFFCVVVSLSANYLTQVRALDVIFIPTLGIINRFQFLGNPSNVSAAIIAVIGLILINLYINDHFKILILRVFTSALIVCTFSRAGILFLIPIILHRNVSKNTILILSFVFFLVFSFYLGDRFSLEKIANDVRFEYWFYLLQQHSCTVITSCLFGKGQFIVSDNTYLSTYFSFGFFGLSIFVIALIRVLYFLPIVFTIPWLVFIGFVDIQGNLLLLSVFLIYVFFYISIHNKKTIINVEMRV